MISSYGYHQHSVTCSTPIPPSPPLHPPHPTTPPPPTPPPHHSPPGPHHPTPIFALCLLLVAQLLSHQRIVVALLNPFYVFIVFGFARYWYCMHSSEICSFRNSYSWYSWQMSQKYPLSYMEDDNELPADEILVRYGDTINFHLDNITVWQLRRYLPGTVLSRWRTRLSVSVQFSSIEVVSRGRGNDWVCTWVEKVRRNVSEYWYSRGKAWKVCMRR